MNIKVCLLHHTLILIAFLYYFEVSADSNTEKWVTYEELFGILWHNASTVETDKWVTYEELFDAFLSSN